MIELTPEDIEINVDSSIAVSTAGNVDVDGIESDIEITFDSNEYSIVGDGVAVLTKYEDAPQWMKDVINGLIDVKTSIAVGDLEATKEALDAMLVQLDVAKNTYELSIVSSNDIDQRITTAIETLNSSLQAADATIMSVAQTATTPGEASAIALNTLNASLSASGVIGSAISNLQTAFADLESTTAMDISYLNSVMQGEIEGNATAMETIRTYVGINENGGITGTGLLADVEILQKQNDGIIETTTGTYDVMVNPQDPNLAQLVTTAEPYATWKAADATGISNRLAHIGDVYVKYADTANGAKEYVASYKFIRTVVDETSPYATDSDGFTWALIVDQAAQDAYEQALNAYDLADNKRRVFTATPSGPYDIGDLWTKSTANGSMLYKSEVKRTAAGYDLQDWVVADDAGLNQFVDNTYNPMVNNLQNQVDSKIENWYTASTSDPKTAWTDVETRNKHNGDLWYQTDTKNSYYYSSSTHSWNILEDSKAIQALSAAATAQATADGVVVSYYAIKQDTAPATANLWLNKTGTKVLKKYDTSWVNVSVKVGDTLTAYDPDTKDISIYVYNGSSWITNTENGIVATSEWGIDLNAYLDNKAVGGTSSLISDITATSNNNLSKAVNSRFAYNSNLVIDGVTYPSGFGLSNSAGTGIGSEFWIDASRLKFTNSAKTGSKAPFTIDASGTQPEITFNGKVSFSNVTDYTPPDVSGDINANNDLLAQRLGYLNYASMVAAATNGNTVIIGGHINTSLIEASAINANQVNTVGLIAENISANEIVGKTITGSILNGASINGSVIKTSYLDLDGDLEVLTDYHLCTSQSQLDALLASGSDGRLVVFNDKVENGGDAIFMEASNEYRIPTISSISEPIQTYTGKGTKTLVGSIFPYNYTTANSNLKSRKKRPTITVTNISVIYSSNSLGPNAYLGYNGGGGYPLLPNTPNFSNGNGTLVEIWFGGVLLVRFGSYYPYDITHRCYVYDALTQTYVDGGIYLTYSPSSLDKTLTLTTSTFDVKLHYTRGYSQYCNGDGCYSSSGGSLTLSLLPKSFVLPFDFTLGNLEIRSVYSSAEADFNLTIPSGIIINNMI